MEGLGDAYIPEEGIFSCLTGLDSAMLSCNVGAKTATDIAVWYKARVWCAFRCVHRTKAEKVT